MKSFLIIPFVALSCLLTAQAPANDNCSGIIDLGEVPYCSAVGQYTNVNATTSNIDPTFNIPVCFNNSAERDVWFQFSLPVDGSITDITVSVWGNIGGNGTLRMPELALYRGSCVFGGLSELACQAAPLNVNELHLDMLGLAAGETYFLRINDYSATGTPNSGTFKLCVEAYVPDFNMGDVPGTQSCSGTLWDSGGETGSYSVNENLTFTICPLDFHQCIQINVLDYMTESGFDFIRVYEGNGTTGPLVAELDGTGVDEQIYVSGGGCATIEFESDGTVIGSGFHLTWLCTPDKCPAPPPTPPSAATCDAALSINNCSTVLPNIISLQPGQGDPTFLVDNVNTGCIAAPSFELNFAFFFFTAQANGEFGFLVKNGDPNNPSDIDFNVWGPIDNEADICDFVSNNQPVRSSWTAAPDPENPDGWTGLTNTNPYTNAPITDEFDCGSPATPGQGILPTDDSFVKTLPVQQGKIYVVMLDDYDAAVSSDAGISIEFPGTSSGILDPVNGAQITVSDDVTVCGVQPIQLQVTGGLGYAWSPDATLSCNTCPNPVALPTETTTYLVQVATTCALVKDSVTVTFATLDLGPDVTVCSGASFMLNENGFPGDYFWTGATSNLDCSNCASPTFTANSGPGIYTLLCTLVTPQCSFTDVIKVTVVNGVQPEIVILPDTAICAGDLISLGGPGMPGFTYHWTSNLPGFSAYVPDPDLPNPAPFAPPSSATYYLEVLSPSCALPRHDSVVVEVYQRPILLLADPAPFCFGGSTVLGNTPFQPGVTYAWTPNDGALNDTTLANPTVTPLIPGTHLYTVTASTPGCSVTRSAFITAVDLRVEIDPGDTVLLCKGAPEDIQLEVLTNSTGAVSVQWGPPPLQNIQLSPDGLMATVSPDTNYVYNIRVSVPGCIRNQEILVQVDSLPPLLNIDPVDTTICRGSIVEVRWADGEPLYEPAHFPFITFQWTPLTGVISTDTLAFLEAQPQNTTTYYRTTTNGGCTDLDSILITVIIPPEIHILPEVSNICQDSMLQLLSDAVGFDSLKWDPTGSVSCDTCQNTVATPFGNTTYVLMGFYDICSVTSNPAIVNVNPPPVYEFPTGIDHCSGEVLRLNSLPDPSGTTVYTWSSSPPLVIPPGVQPEVTLSSMGVDSVTFYLEAQTIEGCIVRDTFGIRVTGVTLTLSPPPTICPGDTAIITAQPSITGGQFTWSNNASTPTIAVTPMTTTTYTVNYALNGCSFQESVSVEVKGAAPEIGFPSDLQVCKGDSILLNSILPMAGSTYEWSTTGTIVPQGANPFSPPLQTNTTYTVKATSIDGCVTIDTVDIVVFRANVVGTGPDMVCAGDAFSVSAAGSATGTYAWSPNGAVGPSFTETLDGEQIIDYIVDFTYGDQDDVCHAYDTVVVEVLRNFAVKIVADPDSVFNSSESVSLDAVIQPSQSVTGFTFEWLENNTVPVGNTQQITVTPTTTDTTIAYKVIVVSPNGCTQEAIIRFRVLQPTVSYANAFTPNGDGSNDSFGLVVLEGIALVEKLEIYNRWGQKVFESTDPKARWDGTTEGKDAPSDVYIFKMRWRRGDGSLTVKNGEVTLIR